MPKIIKIKGRQVFDSRGNPTIEAEVYSDDGNHASAIVPSGASTGTHEAFELRDLENKEYLGKSVLKSVENVNSIISKTLNNFDIFDQRKIDQTLIDLDGTKQKKKLGAKLSHCTSLKLDTVASKLIPPAVKLKRSPIDRFIEAAISLSTDTDGGARSLNHHSPSTTKLFSGKASNHVRLASRSIIFCALTGSPDDEVTPSNRPRINGVKVMGCSNLSLKKELISAVS